MGKLTKDSRLSSNTLHSAFTGYSAVVSVETAIVVLKRCFAISGDISNLEGER